MMFNGLLMCTDSDSDFAKESRSSAAESPNSSCASARAQYYQNKLLATLRVLQNKEETVRVQAESLEVAEARIATLTARSVELKREIERKGQEIQTLRKALEECRVEKTDVSITADIPEMDNQENVVIVTLQNNLGIVEELYRDCFYETIKQDNLIELLRKSYLDVRLMEKEKSDRIYKLHNVINTQKWSLDKCQDIATEVENLKMEISNFINSSSNDSGMWEESVVGGLNEDLQDIAAQLLRLRDLLTGDCTCGLEEENMKLRQNASAMETEMGDLRTKISDLEANLRNKDILDKQYQEQIQSKEKELKCIREQLQSLEQKTNDKSLSCEMLTHNLSQTQVILESKTSEIFSIQKQCEVYKEKIRIMQGELNKMEQITKENVCIREELCATSHRAARLQRRADALAAELSRATDRLDRVDACYSERARSAAQLERQLEEAHARGAALCAEAGRVVRAVRRWAGGARETHREQEERIKEKEAQLRLLEQRLEQIQASQTSPTRRDQCCSPTPTASALLVGERDRYTTATCTSERDVTCSCVPPRNEGSFDPADVGVRERRENGAGTSASEVASCSSAPVPPKRTPRKKLSMSYCGIRRRYGAWGPLGGTQREAGAQHPARGHAATHCDAHQSRDQLALAATRCDQSRLRRPLSPGEEMYSRMESLSAALADSYRRWARRAT